MRDVCGNGEVQQIVNSFFGQSIRVLDCPACQGSGKKIDKPCRDCRGERLVKKTREFQLKVPPGIEAGSRLRLTSGGDKGKNNGPYGDLYVIIHVKEHKHFVREGETIHIRQNIGFSMAALGGELLVPTVDGEKVLKIPTGVQNGTTLVMKDLGVPRFNNPQRRGDQIVHISIETPGKLSSEERKLFERLAELRKESLTVSKEDREAAEKNARREPESVEESKGESKKKEQDDKEKEKDREKESEPVKEESIFDKIVDVFRPKNGEDK